MSTYNAFDLLTDFTSDDLSLLACDRLRSENPPKVARPTLARFLPLKKCREIIDQDSDHLLESGFGKKFGPSEDRQIEKGAFSGNVRGVVNKGVKRSLLDDPNSKLLNRPKKEVGGEKSEDSFKVSVKNRLHVHRCLAGRSLARKISGTKRGVPWKGSRWWVEDEYLDLLESEECSYEDLDDFLSDDAFEGQVIRTLIEEHDFDNKTTLEQYEKVMEEKKQVLQATLQEISAKHQEEEDFINEFVIIEAEDDEFEVDELDDFLLV